MGGAGPGPKLGDGVGPEAIGSSTVKARASCFTGRETAPCPDAPSAENTAKRTRPEARNRAVPRPERSNAVTEREREVLLLRVIHPFAFFWVRSNGDGLEVIEVGRPVSGPSSERFD